MRVLVIPDIHLKPWIFDRTEKILRDGKADRAVCLMDMPDDWNMEFQIERYKETFDRAIVFAKGDALLDGDVKSVFKEKDILEKAYLEQPYTMQLCYELGYKEAFLNPEDFVAYKKANQ